MAGCWLGRSGHWSQEINGLRELLLRGRRGSRDKSFVKGKSRLLQVAGDWLCVKGAFRRRCFVWTAFFVFRRWSLEPDWLAQGALQTPRSVREGLAIASLPYRQAGILTWHGYPRVSKILGFQKKKAGVCRRGGRGMGKLFLATMATRPHGAGRVPVMVGVAVGGIRRLTGRCQIFL